MSDELRSLSDVSDDEIVELVASYGLLGIVLGVDVGNDEHHWSGLVTIGVRLGIYPKNDGGTKDCDILKPLANRLVAMVKVVAPRIAIPLDERLVLTPAEWARRMVGITEDQARGLLEGSEGEEWEKRANSPTTWLDEEAHAPLLW